MSPSMKVVLIGASGNLGAIILRSLLQESALEVTVLTRSSSEHSFPPEVAVIKSDYSEADLIKVFEGKDAIVSAVGAAGLLEQKVFIEAAVKAGVKRFIPSEFSVNTLSEAVRNLVPVFGLKKQVLDLLKQKEPSGLTWTGLGAGLLFDWGLHSGFLGFDLPNKKATIWDEGKIDFSVTNQGDLGKAVVSILSHLDETANQYIYAATVTTSQKAILDSLEAQTGKEWEVEHVETEDQIRDARKKVSEGDLTGVFTLVQASAYGAYPGTRANYVSEEKLANSILGLQEGSVDGTVKDVLKSYD